MTKFNWTLAMQAYSMSNEMKYPCMNWAEHWENGNSIKSHHLTKNENNYCHLHGGNV